MLYPTSWRDEPFLLEQDSSHVPAMAACGSAGWRARKWQVNDRMLGTAHIGHAYVPDTQIALHIHWKSAGTNTTRPVAWQWEVWHAKGHDQQAFALNGPGIMCTASHVSGGPFQHMITETDLVTIPGLEPDSYVFVIISRISNGGTENTDPVFAWCSDIHHQITIVGTPNRKPPFYDVP